jgi:O-acetyl-ADP-ribose deacetylase (regulator of RNase III)
MSTTFVKGDLFEDGVKDVAPPHAFAFAADCSGAMTKGIAIAFRKRWPAFADAYQAHAAAKKVQLGEVFPWRDGEVVVYALGIQQGEKKPKVSTLARALDAMIAMAVKDGVTRIALPRIGAGKGGIDRVRVKKVLTEIGDKSPAVSLVVFEQFIRASTNEPATTPEA